MSDEKEEKGVAKEIAVKVAVELAKQVYEDGAQPLVRSAGALVALPFRLLNACVMDVQAMLTDYESRHRALERGMTERWAKIPPERLVAPPANIAGPLLLGYAFVQDENNAPLREMYEQLLASAMDSETQPRVHPSFVEMLRQMTPVEARLIHHLASIDGWRVPIVNVEIRVKKDRTVTVLALSHNLPDDVAADIETSLNNLERLNIVDLTFRRTIPGADYERLRAEAAATFASHEVSGSVLELTNGAVSMTHLGSRFIRACVADAQGEEPDAQPVDAEYSILDNQP